MIRPVLAALAAVLLAATLPPLPAQAQMGPGGFGNLGAGGTTRMRPPEEQQRRAPPPGLPGLTARPSGQPVPAETDPQGLSPNDALFDGIARGDIGTVRDAVNRGADVNARNALGLTGLDAAVDQGRPEITFYLLSIRGTAGHAPPPDTAPAPRRGRADPEVTRQARAEARGAPPAPAAAPPRLPVLWAGNGGAPQPEIGFLGFDAGRPTGGPGGAERASARRG